MKSALGMFRLGRENVLVVMLRVAFRVILLVKENKTLSIYNLLGYSVCSRFGVLVRSRGIFYALTCLEFVVAVSLIVYRIRNDVKCYRVVCAKIYGIRKGIKRVLYKRVEVSSRALSKLPMFSREVN